jgi:hypothetical protein
MSSPPPDQWLPPQPIGGPSQGPPFGPPPWGPPQPPGPPNRGSGLKWVLGAVVLLVVVAVSVGATLLFTRGDNGGESPTGTASPTSTSGPASDIASAKDVGPAGIITEDPTCAPWGPIGDTLAAEQSNGWDKRDPSVPVSEWTPEVRAQYDAVGRAMRTAADQAVPLAKLTPHRVMRELYEQTIAYWRAYADTLPQYAPADDNLALVANSTSGALVWICSAIRYGSAQARAPLVARAPPPSDIPPIGDPADPQRFLTRSSPVCAEWASNVTQYNADTAAWKNGVDPNLSASQWPPEQRTLFQGILTVLRTNATAVQQLGFRSDNQVFEDFAVVAAQYQRGYVQAIPTYTAADNYLLSAASQLVVANNHACLAAG